MQKIIFILILFMVFFAAGCAKEEMQVPGPSTTTEYAEENDSHAVENTEQEQNASADYAISSLDDYMAAVKEQSDSIKTSLEQDALSQSEMNVKSQELYELWDKTLNYLWDELKNSMPEAEFVKLLDEQIIWITDKENATKAAGKEFEGGSIYPLIVNSEAAAITEERVYELYEILKQTV